MTNILKILFKILPFAFMLLHINAFCQNYNSAFDKIHNDILNLKTENTQQKLLAISVSSPLGNQLTCYSDFIDVLTSTKETNRIETINKFNKQLEFLNTLNESQEQLIAICDIQLFKAMLAFLNKEYLWSTTEYIKAKKIMKRLSEKYPENYINYKYNLIEIFADILLSENLPFNKTSDEKQLKKEYTTIIQKVTADKNIPDNIKKEIRILTVLLCPYIDNNNKNCFDLAKSFYSGWEKSGPIEAMIFAGTAEKAHEYGIAHNTLLNAVKLGYGDKLNNINLELGTSYLNQLNDSAITYLNLYIKNQENNKDVTYAQLKLSWYYYINNASDKADKLIKQISTSSKNNTTEERQAKYEVNNYNNWNIDLIKARLLFDGGNYAKCISILVNCNIVNFNKEQLLEYNYRLARAYDLSNNSTKAIRYYQKAIDSNMDASFYYPAYSAFYMGLVYKTIADNTNAKKSFEKCINLKSPIYEWSIHKKAKRELEIIE